jgi:hypothetical protein
MTDTTTPYAAAHDYGTFITIDETRHRGIGLKLQSDGTVHVLDFRTANGWTRYAPYRYPLPADTPALTGTFPVDQAAGRTWFFAHRDALVRPYL